MRRSWWLVFVLGLLAACAPAGPAGPPEPSGGADDDLDQVIATLRRVSPTTEGSVWQDTNGNLLPGDVDQWFLQTPRCWGTTDCPDPVGTDELLRQISDTVASAEVSVDITTLWPYADGGWLDAVVDGLQRSSDAGHRPSVRWLAGSPFFFSYTGVGPDEFRADLVSRLGPVGQELPITVSTMTTALRSWNHAKIVAVDGREAIVGGHNQWAASYLTATPVSDVSMKVRGPAAATATGFADILWGYVCDRESEGFASLLWIRSSHSGPGAACPRTSPVLSQVRPGDMRILAVGRLGIDLAAPGVVAAQAPQTVGLPLPEWICPTFDGDATYEAANPGLVAARALVASADEKVFISQQDLLSQCPRYDPTMLRIITDQLARGVEVTIVVTGAFGTSYANMESLNDLSGQLYDVLRQRIPDPTEAQEVLCANLQLASLRIGDEPTWPDGAGFANHAKFIHVDDQVFSVGSNNMYPASLQEFDLVVDDETAAQQVRTAYLDPLWEWSKADAVIDPDQGRCDIFG